MDGFKDMRSPVTTIFCDFDGPIVDVSDRYYQTYQQALTQTHRHWQQQGRDLNLTPLQKWQFWELKQERTPDIEIALRSGLPENAIDYFRDRVVEIVNSPEMLKLDRIQPGVDWALNLLCSQGMRLVLVTLRHTEQVHQILRQHQLDRLFVGIYGTQSDSAAYQNYAELKTELLRRAIHDHLLPGEHHRQAWTIGDTEADIIAGRTMGLPTIGLTCGIRSHNQLKQLAPTLIQPDLLSAAHYAISITSPMLSLN
jgi:phosphoglycolate phosphatase